MINDKLRNVKVNVITHFLRCTKNYFYEDNNEFDKIKSRLNGKRTTI